MLRAVVVSELPDFVRLICSRLVSYDEVLIEDFVILGD